MAERMRALIVDDVPSVRKYIAMCLTGIANLELHEAGDGIEALRLANEKPFDVLILDINIPLLNGLRVLGAVRQWDTYKHTPAIIISTDASPEVREQVSALGGHLHPKPFNAFAMRDLVRQVLHQGPARARDETDERRSAPRLPCRLQVELIEPHRRIEMETKNVSMTGAFLVSDVQVQEGEQGRLKLKFPHLPEPLVLDCVVVHTRTYQDRPVGFGIRFDIKDPALVEQLAKAFMSEAR